MVQRQLFKLPLDSSSIEDVRDYFGHLEERRETFERGLAIENMNAEVAWLDDDEPALYYLHEEGDEYPADVDEADLDEELQELSSEHHAFFKNVIASGHDHPDDLIEFERLFSASASELNE
jgi:hypothetical protein